MPVGATVEFGGNACSNTPGERARIGEARNARVGTEVMIERPVLLHHEHDMLDVGQPAGAVLRGERLANRL